MMAFVSLDTGTAALHFKAIPVRLITVNPPLTRLLYERFQSSTPTLCIQVSIYSFTVQRRGHVSLQGPKSLLSSTLSSRVASS
jgi:hypothetical protein